MGTRAIAIAVKKKRPVRCGHACIDACMEAAGAALVRRVVQNAELDVKTLK